MFAIVWKEPLLRPMRKNAIVMPAARILLVNVEQRNANPRSTDVSRKTRKRQEIGRAHV